MKKFIMSAMAAMVFAMGAVSVAQAGEAGGYVGAGMGMYTIKPTGAGAAGMKSNNAFGGHVSLGYDTGYNVAVEGRVFTTAKTDLSAVAVTNNNAKMGYGLSYLVKPYAELYSVNVYGLLGGTTARLDAFGTKYNKTGFSFGMGAEMGVADNFTVGLEWFRPWNNVDLGAATNVNVTVDSFSITSTYRF